MSATLPILARVPNVFVGMSRVASDDADLSADLAEDRVRAHFGHPGRRSAGCAGGQVRGRLASRRFERCDTRFERRDAVWQRAQFLPDRDLIEDLHDVVD